MDTVDLHDLATTLSERRCKHSNLREINDRLAPRTILRDTSLPVIDEHSASAFFLVENDSEVPKSRNPLMLYLLTETMSHQRWN